MSGWGAHPPPDILISAPASTPDATMYRRLWSAAARRRFAFARLAALLTPSIHHRGTETQREGTEES
jgi:hypothetical protein